MFMPLFPTPPIWWCSVESDYRSACSSHAWFPVPNETQCRFPWIDSSELTVKRLYRQNGDIMLVPENPDYEPRLIKEGEELKVHGVVTFIIHPAS